MSNLKKSLTDATRAVLAQTKPVNIRVEDLPKFYAHAVQEHKVKDHSYGDYENSQVKFNYQDDYEFVTKLGRGRYSEVFKATNLLTNKDAVIKILKPGKSIQH